MIKLKITLIAVSLILLLFSGCHNENSKQDNFELNSSVSTFDTSNNTDKTSKEDEDILIIGENMFLTQISDIYFNFECYANKTIIIEGIFTEHLDPYITESKPMVYRNGPGCCGNDGWGGFYLTYDGEYPEENSWIKVKGKPKLIEKGFFRELHLIVSSIEFPENRGEEFVFH